MTIEGLAPNGKLHAVQEAFLEADAMQCGWCTPGMILGAVALLEHTPHPSDADIVSGMNGHICRCGTYGRVVRAGQMASKTAGGGPAGPTSSPYGSAKPRCGSPAIRTPRKPAAATAAACPSRRPRI